MKSKIKLYLLPIGIIIFILSSCLRIQTHSIIDNEIQASLNKNYKIKGLFNHFPKQVKQKLSGTILFPPLNIAPEAKCNNQEFKIIIIGNKTNYFECFKNSINDSVQYITDYFNSNNFIINIRKLNAPLFLLKKCNKYYKDKIPIPCYECCDFGLGINEALTKQLKREPRPRYHTIYNVPKDLKVYVLAAQAGNFWKFDCKENRPESLGKWKHGYSKGVAVSDKYDRVVFWVIIW